MERDIEEIVKEVIGEGEILKEVLNDKESLTGNSIRKAIKLAFAKKDKEIEKLEEQCGDLMNSLNKIGLENQRKE